MWPFKSKPHQPTEKELDIQKLEAWRPVGTTFEYLGRTCIVTRHWHHQWCGINLGMVLRVSTEADYADVHGVIHSIQFDWEESLRLAESQP